MVGGSVVDNSLLERVLASLLEKKHRSIQDIKRLITPVPMNVN